MSDKQGSKPQTGFAIAWLAIGVISVLLGLIMKVPKRAQDHFHGIVHGGGDDACLLHALAAYPCVFLFTLYGIVAIVFTFTADTKRVRKLGIASIVSAILLVAMWGAMAKSFDEREEQREAQRLESEVAEWDAQSQRTADVER